LNKKKDRTIIVKKGNTHCEMVSDRVFSKEATQLEVYEVVKDSIEAVIMGYNATVFA